MALVLDLKVANRHQDGDRGSSQEKVEEVEGEAIHHERAHESGEGRNARSFRLSNVIGVMQLAHSRS